MAHRNYCDILNSRGDKSSARRPLRVGERRSVVASAAMVALVLVAMAAATPMVVEGAATSSNQLPSFMKPCLRNDPNLKKCVLEEGRRVIRRFSEGIPEMNVEPLDPLYVGDIDTVQGGGSLTYKQRDITIKGFKDSRLVDLKFDEEKKIGHAHVIGNITSKSNYTIDGQLLIFPVTGKGDCTIKIRDFDLKMDWQWDLYKGPDGEMHSKIVKHKSTFDYDKVQIKLTGLFNNDKFLGDTLNNFLSTNSKDIMKDLGGPTIKKVEEKTTQIFNSFFGKVPYSDLFPIS